MAVICSGDLDEDRFFACLGPSLTGQQMRSPNLFLGYGRADEPHSEGCLLLTFSPTRVFWAAASLSDEAPSSAGPV